MATQEKKEQTIKKSGKSTSTKQDDKLAVKGSFLDIMKAAVKHADKNSEYKKNHYFLVYYYFNFDKDSHRMAGQGTKKVMRHTSHFAGVKQFKEEMAKELKKKLSVREVFIKYSHTHKIKSVLLDFIKEDLELYPTK